MNLDNCIPVTHGDEVEYPTGSYPVPVCGGGIVISQMPQGAYHPFLGCMTDKLF